jgi:hypothetical protein
MEVRMFSIKEMAEFTVQLYNLPDSEADSIRLRYRNFRGKGLILPMETERLEANEEHLFTVESAAKAIVFSAFTDFGFGKKELEKVLASMDAIEFNFTPMPNQLSDAKKQFAVAMQDVAAGKERFIYATNGCGHFDVHWKKKPVGPHVTIPLQALLKPLLDLKAEG